MEQKPILNSSQQNSILEDFLQKIDSIYKKYNIESIQQIAHLTFDIQLSRLFKSKSPQQYFQDSQLDQKLLKMSKQHTYNQIYIYYQQFSIYLDQCKKIMMYKYQKDDILRTHNNRKSIWLLCSGALNKIKQNPDFYHKITQYRQFYPQFFKHTILKDVVRTVYDKNKQSQNLLSSILRNIAIRNPYVGYCQGMNFIVNFLILMQFTQQESFWITIQLIQNILPKNCYTNMLSIAIQIRIIEHYIKIYSPNVYQKLQQMNISLSLIVLQWLVCLYTSTLPFYMLVIVWDMMFIYGKDILLKVCIVILNELSQTILNTQDLSELLIKIQNKKRNIFIEEEPFITRINSIFIDEHLLQIFRELIQLQLKIQKIQINQKVKQNKKPRQIQCNIQWPICYKALKQYKSDTQQIQVWTFKQEGPVKFINDYLIIKNKNIYNPLQDSRTDQMKLQIGRIPHICDVNSYSKKQRINGQVIQLQEFNIMNRKTFIQNFSLFNQNNINNSYLSLFRQFPLQRSATSQQQINKIKNNKNLLQENTLQVKKIHSQTLSQIGYKQKKSQSNQTLYRGSKIQDSQQNQIQAQKYKNQKQIDEKDHNEEVHKTRNPFKRLRNKWKQRKQRKLQKHH